MPPADSPERLTCASCGTTVEGGDAVASARLTWSRGVERGRPVWTCERCVRGNVRSIEGKLDSEWW